MWTSIKLLSFLWNSRFSKYFASLSLASIQLPNPNLIDVLMSPWIIRVNSFWADVIHIYRYYLWKREKEVIRRVEMSAYSLWLKWRATIIPDTPLFLVLIFLLPTRYKTLFLWLNFLRPFWLFSFLIRNIFSSNFLYQINIHTISKITSMTHRATVCHYTDDHNWSVLLVLYRCNVNVKA